MRQHLGSLLWIGLGVALGIVLFTAWQPVHAYPEYTDRTGQQCTACHINPAGGGPRTLRGLLWIAEGRPDTVPALPGSEKAGDEALDGPALYAQFECSRCHGSVGEGDVGGALMDREWTTEQLIDVIRNGFESMKGYAPAVMSDEEMNALIPYIQAIGRGEVQSSLFLQKRPLPPARFVCGAYAETEPIRTDCGGN